MQAINRLTQGKNSFIEWLAKFFLLLVAIYWLHIAGIWDAELGASRNSRAGITVYITSPHDIPAWMTPISLVAGIYLASSGRLGSGTLRSKPFNLLIALTITQPLFMYMLATRKKGVSYGRFKLHPLILPGSQAAYDDDNRLPCVATNRGGACIMKQHHAEMRIPPSSFHVYRLGNLLDHWWTSGVWNHTASIVDNETEKIMRTVRHDFDVLADECPEGSLGRFLLSHPPAIASENVPRNMSSPFWARSSWWWLYFYDAMQDVNTGFGYAVRQALEEYVFMSGIRVPLYDPYTCVVHYRLGDVVADSKENYSTLEPVAMARSLFQWSLDQNLEIREIHVLGSGNLMHRASDDTMLVSKNILTKFIETAQSLFTKAVVYLDTNGQPDEDFIKMVNAPMLFTSHGSFATAALLANTGHKASPACQNLNFPSHGALPAGKISPGWHIYAFEVCDPKKYMGKFTHDM
jgi:hypothetical protein